MPLINVSQRQIALFIFLMIGLVFVAVFLSLVSACFVFFIFKYFGAFRLPFYAIFSEMFLYFIQYLIVVVLVPYDVSLSIGIDEPIDHSALETSMEMFYWLTCILSYIILPVAVSYSTYPKNISHKHRIKMAIQSNFRFYIVCGVALLFGMIFLLIKKTLTFSLIKPLIISLINGYGLFLMCILMGHGYVALPRTLWKQADPKVRYKYFISRIGEENKVLNKAVANGRRLLEVLFKVGEQTTGIIHERFDHEGRARETVLSRLTFTLPVELDGTVCDNKIELLNQINWNIASTSQLEELFCVVDSTSDSIDQANRYITYLSNEAYKSYTETNKVWFYLNRMLAVLAFIVSGISIWSELTLMIEPEFSPYYIIVRSNVSPYTLILFILAPILLYLLFIGSWSLTRFKVGSFFRFIEAGTSLQTFYFYVSIMSKLAPTVGYHFLKQIGCENSSFVQVMGVMENIVLLGTVFNKYSPILLILVVIFVATNFWDNLLEFFELGDYTFNELEEITEINFANGERLFLEMHPEARNGETVTNDIGRIFEGEPIIDQRDEYGF